MRVFYGDPFKNISNMKKKIYTTLHLTESETNVMKELIHNVLYEMKYDEDWDKREVIYRAIKDIYEQLYNPTD